MIYTIYAGTLGKVQMTDDLRLAKQLMKRYVGGPHNFTALARHAWVEDESGNKVAELDRRGETT